MSKAAVQLAISQPAVSKAITEMELTLGVPLLDRGPRGVEPTLFGRDLLERNVELLVARALPPLVDEDLELELLFNERQVVVAGSGSKWARRRKVKIAELLNEPWIFPPPGSVPASIVSDAFLAAGLK